MSLDKTRVKKIDIFYLTVTSVYLCSTKRERSRSSECQGQGYSISRSSKRKLIFCQFVTYFVICVSRE